MRTLVHLTGDDRGDVDHAIRSAALLWRHEDLPHEDVALLAHRRAVRFVAPGSPVAEGIGDLLDRGVTVKAGATCFDANDLPREALRGVEVVPSGVSEVVRLQSEGYSYVKVP